MSVIDPATSAPLALAGRIVTMDEAALVLDDGVLYAGGGRIVAVKPPEVAPPAGFEQVPVVVTGGTLYPGLIELHNHQPYAVLPLWPVPRRFGDRGQWQRSVEYRQRVTAPMTVLGADPDLTAAIVRYAEEPGEGRPRRAGVGVGLGDARAQRSHRCTFGVRSICHPTSPSGPVARELQGPLSSRSSPAAAQSRAR